jgi:hypothetical protein
VFAGLYACGDPEMPVLRSGGCGRGRCRTSACAGGSSGGEPAIKTFSVISLRGSNKACSWC